LKLLKVLALDDTQVVLVFGSSMKISPFMVVSSSSGTVCRPPSPLLPSSGVTTGEEMKNEWQKYLFFRINKEQDECRRENQAVGSW
jgi:hypothetical protein